MNVSTDGMDSIDSITIGCRSIPKRFYNVRADKKQENMTIFEFKRTILRLSRQFCRSLLRERERWWACGVQNDDRNSY